MTIFIDRHGLIDGEHLLDMHQQTLKYLILLLIYRHRQLILIKLLKKMEGLVGGLESNPLPVKHGECIHHMVPCDAMHCDAMREENLQSSLSIRDTCVIIIKN